MAELTGVPYSRIMLVAIFPALMYFFSVFVMVLLFWGLPPVLRSVLRPKRRGLTSPWR